MESKMAAVSVKRSIVPSRFMSKLSHTTVVQYKALYLGCKQSLLAPKIPKEERKTRERANVTVSVTCQRQASMPRAAGSVTCFDFFPSDFILPQRFLPGKDQSLYWYAILTLSLHFSQKYALSPSSISPLTNCSRESSNFKFFTVTCKEWKASSLSYLATRQVAE